MRSRSLVNEENQNIALSLLQEVGSAHDNMAFVDTLPSIQQNEISTTTERNLQENLLISFQDINFYSNSNSKAKCFRCWKSKPRKQILFNLTGGFSSGMNAILG